MRWGELCNGERSYRALFSVDVDPPALFYLVDGRRPFYSPFHYSLPFTLGHQPLIVENDKNRLKSTNSYFVSCRQEDHFDA